MNPLHERVAAPRAASSSRDLGAGSVLDAVRAVRVRPARPAPRPRGVPRRRPTTLYRAQHRRGAAPPRRAWRWPRRAPPDLARLWRAPEFDAGVPRRRARCRRCGRRWPALGIDLDAQANVELDVEARPGKVPRAFCAPIRVPGRVVLVMLPQGGQDDYRALFHEAGHAEHFAHMPRRAAGRGARAGRQRRHRGLRVPVRAPAGRPGLAAAHLGDGGRPEYTALLRPLQALPRPPLRGQAGVRARAARAARRSSGCRRATPSCCRARPACPIPTTDYLEDVDDGFYCTSLPAGVGVRGPARDHLRTRFGRAWFGEPGGRRAAARDVGPGPVAARPRRCCGRWPGVELDFAVLAAEAEAAP